MQRERAQNYRNAGESEKAIDAYKESVGYDDAELRTRKHLQRVTETICADRR